LSFRNCVSPAETSVVLVYLGFVLPLISLGTDDIRLAGAFSLDEAGIATEIRRMREIGFFELPSFKYGGIFYYVPLLFLNVWGLFGKVTDELILVVTRSFGALSGGGCLWMTWRIGRLVFNRTWSWIASFLFLLSPVFLRWSIESHPDLPQLFFLLCGLYYGLVLCGGYETRALVLSSVFAGLAFGTKYSGVFLLPVIGLSVLLPDEGILSPGSAFNRLKKGRTWVKLLAIPAVFCATFAMTNPHALLAFDAFQKSLLMEKGIMSFGHTLRVEAGAMAWLEMLWGLLGQVHGLVFLATLVVWVWYVKKKGGIPATRGMLVLWMALFVTYLMVEVNLRRPRHLLPVVPCGLLVVGYVYTQIWDRLRDRMRYGYVLAIPVLLLVSWDHVWGTAKLFGERWTRVEANEELAVGRWLAANYPPETSILYDAYSYVPNTFGNVFRSFGASYPMVAHFEPDLIVVRDAIHRDFEDPEDAEKSRRGEADFLDRHYFYKYLKAGLIPGYGLAKRFPTLSVYERMSGKVREDADIKGTWMKLARHYYSGRIHGKVTAGWVMGHIHRSQGLEEEAERAFREARTSNNFAVRIFNHGRRALTENRLEEAKHAFDEALAAAAERSESYRSGMRASISDLFFKAGY